MRKIWEYAMRKLQEERRRDKLDTAIIIFESFKIIQMYLSIIKVIKFFGRYDFKILCNFYVFQYWNSIHP